MDMIYKVLDKFGYYKFRKALLVPINSKGEILLQDRAGHRPPPWGCFGGGIEQGETPVEAVLREVKEELDLDLTVHDIQYIGTVTAIYPSGRVIKYMYLYKTEQTAFTVLEGAGAHWLSIDEAGKRLVNDQIHKIMKKVCSV